jgi:hypothetical protein
MCVQTRKFTRKPFKKEKISLDEKIRPGEITLESPRHPTVHRKFVDTTCPTLSFCTHSPLTSRFAHQPFASDQSRRLAGVTLESPDYYALLLALLVRVDSMVDKSNSCSSETEYCNTVFGY